MLEQRVAVLEARLNTNSGNSSTPPSANPLGAKPPVVKKKSKRKRGGQPGHRPHLKKLFPPEQVTRTKVFVPEICEACDSKLPQEAGPEDPEPKRFQVAEVPPIVVDVTEYQAHGRTCPCGHVTQATIPAEIRQHSIGPRFTALLSYFSGCHGISKRGVEEIAESRGTEKVSGPFIKGPDTFSLLHFMPIGTLAKGREQTTLVFDTWANLGDDESLIHWACELNGEETGLLRDLAASLGYLGRSESWVEAELIADGDLPSPNFNAFPHQTGIHPGPRWEQTSLMAAIPPDEYTAWQRETSASVLAGYPLPEGEKKPSAKLLKDRAKATAPYPVSLVDCLTKDTVWWKGHGWSQPPGSQRILYWRRSDSLQVGVPQSAKPHLVNPVKTMLLALTTASGNRAALPPCSRTLPQAELFHRAIVGRVGQGRQVHCPELTGKDELRQPLHDHHDHAHILPVDLDSDGHLDHLIVFAAMGLGDAAQRAIRSLRRTWTKGGAGDIQLAVVGSGELDILRQLPPPLQNCIEQLLGPPQGGRVWESATPFVPPRFLKRRGKNTLLGQINAELASRCLPEIDRFEICEHLTRFLRHFVRQRKHGGVPAPIDRGYGLRLVFSDPLPGPLMLGYGSHYGLGMFRAVDD